MIIIADALMNPEITVWDRNFEIAPNFIAPIKSIIAPDNSASVIAALRYSDSFSCREPNVDAVIKDVIATGPTDNVRLEPNRAYSIRGSMLEYMPTSGGTPA